MAIQTSVLSSATKLKEISLMPITSKPAAIPPRNNPMKRLRRLKKVIFAPVSKIKGTVFRSEVNNAEGSSKRLTLDISRNGGY